MRLASQISSSDAEESINRHLYSSKGCDCGFGCSSSLYCRSDLTTTENDDSGFVGDVEGKNRISFKSGASPRKNEFEQSRPGDGSKKFQDTFSSARKMCDRMPRRNNYEGFHGRGRRVNYDSSASCIWNFAENAGYAILELFSHLGHLIKKAPRYQLPILGLVLVLSLYGFYNILMQLEYTFASITGVSVEWLWPVFRGCLRGIAYSLRFCASWIQRFEELIESMLCDWSQLWCDQFKLMCHSRCGFVSKAFERMSCM